MLCVNRPLLRYSQFSYIYEIFIFSFQVWPCASAFSWWVRCFYSPCFYLGISPFCKNVNYGIIFPARTRCLIISVHDIRAALAQPWVFLFFTNYCLRCPKILQYIKEDRVFELSYQLVDKLEKSLKYKKRAVGTDNGSLGRAATPVRTSAVYWWTTSRLIRIIKPKHN